MLRTLLGLGPAPVDDPVFGRLWFRPFKPAPAHSHWCGESVFAPIGQKIVVLVLGDESGPGDGQRALFRRVESRWTELLPKLSAALKAYHADVHNEKLTDPWTRYRLHEMLIPRCETPDIDMAGGVRVLGGR